MPKIARLDNNTDRLAPDAGCDFFGGFFLLDDRDPEGGFGTSPFWVYENRALDLPEPQARRVAEAIADQYHYRLQVGSTDVDPKLQIIADMKAGIITTEEGRSKLRALAASEATKTP